MLASLPQASLFRRLLQGSARDKAFFRLTVFPDSIGQIENQSRHRGRLAAHKEFSKYVLLVNFTNYANWFAEAYGVPLRGLDRPMPNATAITILNFGMGSASAATVMDLHGAIKPKAVLFLGKCGGLKKENKLGDLILPIAAIRSEGTSTNYLPPEVPALPAFSLLKAISTTIRNYGKDYWTGTLDTTLPSKNISRACAAWGSTWRSRPFSSPAFTTRSRPARSSLSPSN